MADALQMLSKIIRYNPKLLIKLNLKCWTLKINIYVSKLAINKNVESSS